MLNGGGDIGRDCGVLVVTSISALVVGWCDDFPVLLNTAPRFSSDQHHSMRIVATVRKHVR